VARLPIRGASKLPEKLLTHRDAAFLARRLTEIVRDAPIEATREDLRLAQPNRAALDEFFDRHQFGPMLRRQSERLAALQSTVRSA